MFLVLYGEKLDTLLHFSGLLAERQADENALLLRNSSLHTWCGFQTCQTPIYQRDAAVSIVLNSTYH